MNKTPRLSKSGIEYLDYQWGVFSGCYNWRNGICGGGGKDFNCWAKGFATRFSNIYPNGFEPTFYPEALDSPLRLKKPSIIGVGWVGDVIGYSSPAVRIAICDAIKHCSQHSFLFLTKNPDKLIEWKFPDNCWVGVTATDPLMWNDALRYLTGIKASVKYISIEPYLGVIVPSIYLMRKAQLKWIIVGSRTKPYRPPTIEAVEEIVRAAGRAGIPVFLKNNLVPILENRKPFISTYKMNQGKFTQYPRQEMPR